MAAIDPDGLFGGDRIRALSDKAKLYWPWLYCAANGYARLELNPHRIINRCFGAFVDPPNEAQLLAVLAEYVDNFLILSYRRGTTTWLQFHTPSSALRRHKTRNDKATPEPTDEEWQEFNSGYEEWKHGQVVNLKLVPRNSELFPQSVRGSGIGSGSSTGIGIGTGIGNERAPEPPAPPPPEPPPTPPPAGPVPTGNPDVQTLVQRIVVTHPRSALRHMRFNEIPYGYSTAVITAMHDETERTGCSPIAALEMILQRVEIHARDVPLDQHRFIKDVPDYMRLHDYRMDARELSRQEDQNERPTRPTTKTAGTVDALERAHAITRRRASPGADSNPARQAWDPPPGPA